MNARSLQTTDSSFVPVFPRGESFSIAFTQPNETVGGSLNILFFPLSHSSRLMEDARRTVLKTANKDVSRPAIKLLSVIEECLAKVERERNDFASNLLPPLHAFGLEDGSILIEWIFGSFRIGFTIEPSPEESGWYLVSNRELGDISASGYTSDKNIKSMVSWLLGFVLDNM
jgi:hypothetical protein